MRCLLTLFTVLVVGVSQASAGILLYDADVSNAAIFGSGNTNGSFTVNRQNGVELGLRAKLRHNASGAPENTFNSNGDGTYTFQSGVAPTQSSPTAEWSFEWSINSNFDGTSGFNLNDLTYALSMTSTTGAEIVAGDLINVAQADHSIGTNATTSGQGEEAGSAAEYLSLISNNNLAQNSWKPHWFATNFDPTDNGTYNFVLSAFNANGEEIARTAMSVNAVPEPNTLLVFSAILGMTALPIRRRRA